MKVILAFLLALSGLGISVANADSDDPSKSIGDEPCRARAWVRAPDLEPGKVVQGDVKVKLDGACEEVQSYTLKLQFSERSWVKTRRQGVQLPKRPPLTRIEPAFCTGAFVPGNYCMNGSRYSHLNDPVWNTHINALEDPSLWLVREEERVGFEAEYKLSDGKPTGHDVIESFAILVPSTRYPPASHPSFVRHFLSSFRDQLDAAGSDNLYVYSVEVAFVNGTIVQVPAGYTSFNGPSQLISPPSEPETINVTVSRTNPLIHRMHGHAPQVVESEAEVADVFVLEVTFPHGRHFKQGSVNNVSIVSHQIGLGIERPNMVSCTPEVVQKYHWAASQAADNETAESLLNNRGAFRSQLRPTNPSTDYSYRVIDVGPRNPRFPREERDIINGTMFSTKPIVVQFEVWEDCYPNFQMYHQTTHAELSIFLSIVVDEPDTVIDIEEYDWVPAVERSSPLQSQQGSARIPLFIHSKYDDPTKSEADEGVHYLSPEARAPVFVDPAAVQDLLYKSISERDALSPEAQAKIIVRGGDDVVGGRSFDWENPRGFYYVGDTWLRKVVLPRPENKVGIVEALRVQT